MIDHTTTTADSITSVALCSGESITASLEGHHLTLMDITVGIHLIHTPPITVQGREATSSKRGIFTFIQIAHSICYRSRVGAIHQPVTNCDIRRLPLEGHRSVVCRKVIIVILGNLIHDTIRVYIKLQGIQGDTCHTIALAFLGHRHKLNDHRLSFGHIKLYIRPTDIRHLQVISVGGIFYIRLLHHAIYRHLYRW